MRWFSDLDMDWKTALAPLTTILLIFNRPTYLQSSVFFFVKKALEITRLCYTMWLDLRLSSYDSIRLSLLTLSLTGVRNFKTTTSNSYTKTSMRGKL